MSRSTENSRRHFLKGAAAGVGTLALAGAGCNSGSPKPATGGVPTQWDESADVVVLGYGGAGACAAIEAHDAGATVLIVEKQPEKAHYPNSRMAGGIFHCPDEGYDPEALKQYALALFSGENIPWKLEGEQPEVSEGLADAWAKYCPETMSFMTKMDPEFTPIKRSGSGFGGAAFPNFPGAAASRYNAVFSSYTDRSNFDFSSKDLPKSQKQNGEAYFACLSNGVKTRSNIKVLYETPAKQLIQNATGEVIGVIAMRGNTPIRIQAKRAVVLTTGGYEYNKAMREAFLEGPGVEGWAFYGTTANEGDGIVMANAIGAGLMKVGKAASRLIAAMPVRHNGMKIGMITDTVGTLGTVVVDNHGLRFINETLITRDPSRYFSYKEAVHFDILKLEYPRCPSWMIFDEGLRARRPLTAMGISTVGYGYLPWSQDNMDAIKRGWILQGNTLAELGEKIKDHPENRKLMNPGKLDQTIRQFNQYAAQGKDKDFQRPKATLAALNKPPYYAVPLYAGGPNTKGGLAANAAREVLRWDGSPIPRLFAAGEIASALKFVYQGGGNLTECIVFGRIAGMNAAKLKPWG